MGRAEAAAPRALPAGGLVEDAHGIEMKLLGVEREDDQARHSQPGEQGGEEKAAVARRHVQRLKEFWKPCKNSGWLRARRMKRRRIKMPDDAEDDAGDGEAVAALAGVGLDLGEGDKAEMMARGPRMNWQQSREAMPETIDQMARELLPERTTGDDGMASGGGGSGGVEGNRLANSGTSEMGFQAAEPSGWTRVAALTRPSESHWRNWSAETGPYSF